MYHYVRNEDVNYPSFKFLHFEDFKKQLDYFSDNYTILHPDVLKDCILSGRKAEGIVLTFDDGLTEHYNLVMPELLRRGLSAIFYISTGIYETNKILDVHRLHLLLGRFGSRDIYYKLRSLITDSMLSHAHIAEFQTIPYSRQHNDTYTTMVKRILNYFIGYQFREQVLDQLMDEFFGDDNDLFNTIYLSKNEIRKMNEAGMIIGSHTRTHPVLSKLSFKEQQTEIITSFDYLDQICIKLPYRTFCYPYGGFHSFTNETENILKECGTLFSFNVEQRDITVNDLRDRPHALPRYDCNNFPYGKAWENKMIMDEQK